MSSLQTNKAKTITKKEANVLIFGYVHEFEKEMNETQENIDYSSISQIIWKILDYYPCVDEWKWTKGIGADEVLRIHDDKLQLTNMTKNSNRCCVGNHRISSSECSEYSFEVSLIDYDWKQRYSGMMIGIVNSDQPITESIKSFNTDFSTYNSDNVWSIYLSGGNKFCLYGPGITNQQITESIYNFKAGDRIKIKLDVIEKKAFLFYNDAYVIQCFDFNDWEVVIPGIALWNCHIALTDWSLVDSKH